MESLFRLLKPIVVLLVLVGVLAGVLSATIDLGSKQEHEVWIESKQYISKLKKSPSPSLDRAIFSGFIKSIPDPEKTIEAKSGLMSIIALAVMSDGDIKDGEAAIKYILSNYPDSTFCRYLNKESLCDVCPDCKSKGRIKCKCKYCNGTKKCAQCKGAGKTQAAPTKESFSSPKLHSSGRDSSRRTKTMGSDIYSAARIFICKMCSGRGVCSKCRGSGLSTQRCEKCAGSGQVFSKGKINAQYKSAINAYYPIAIRKSIKSKVYIGLMKMKSLGNSGVEESN